MSLESEPFDMEAYSARHPLVKVSPFRRWLEAQPPNREFLTVNQENCPLATFLREEYDDPFASVGNASYIFQRQSRVMYPWVYHFRRKVDDTAGVGSITSVPITAEDAMKILREVEHLDVDS